MSKKGFKIQTKNKKKIKKKKSKNKEKIEGNLEKKEKIGTSGASGGESFSFFVRTTLDIEENLETFVEALNVSLPSSFQEENRIEKREKKEKYEFTSFYEEKKEKEPEIEKISREAPRESNFLIKEDLLQNFKQQKEPIKIIKDTFVSPDKFDEEKDVQVVKKYLREQKELEEGSKYREKDKYKYKQYIEVT